MTSTVIPRSFAAVDVASLVESIEFEPPRRFTASRAGDSGRRPEARPLVELSDFQAAELSDFRPALTRRVGHGGRRAVIVAVVAGLIAAVNGALVLALATGGSAAAMVSLPEPGHWW
jgi:hypothetical protein